MESEGAYAIWKKVDGWTGRRTDRRTDGSASEKLRWLCLQGN